MEAHNRDAVLHELLKGIERAVSRAIAERRPQIDAAGLGLVALDLRREVDEVLADVGAFAFLD